MKQLAIVLVACGGLWAAEPARKAPIAGNPVVELKGKITKVQVAAGQGMPFIEVDTAGKTSKVYLGSMRYLMEQNFSPKAGSTAVVKGYQSNQDVVAISVAVDGGQTLKLRDESGYPVWMANRHRNRGGEGCCGGMSGKK